MFHFAIVGSNKKSIVNIKENLEGYFSNREFKYEVDVFKNAQDIIEEYKAYGDGLFNLIFYMYDPILDGPENIEILNRLKEVDGYIKIILCSYDIEDAVWGYEIDAFGFLTVPIEVPFFERTLDRFSKNLTARHIPSLLVKRGRNSARIPYNEVLYMESSDKVVYIHTVKDKQYRIYAKLSDVEEELKTRENFLRTHQSFIVNMDYVTSVQKDCFEVDNNKTVPIRKRDSKSIKLIYRRYIEDIMNRKSVEE